MRQASWAVFLSGRGSNAEALWGNLSELDIRLCVSSRKSAAGLLRARRSGIPTLTLESKPDWDNLTSELKHRGISQIFLLGFMKILPAAFVDQWKTKIWNLHPSLLPDFAGAHAIENSYAQGAAIGVSVHEVTAEMDAGPLFLQRQLVDKAKEKNHSLSFEEVQMEISVCEQRLVRETAIRRSLRKA